MARAVIAFSGTISVDEKYEARAVALLRQALHDVLDPLEDKIAGLEIVIVNYPAPAPRPKLARR